MPWLPRPDVRSARRLGLDVAMLHVHMHQLAMHSALVARTRACMLKRVCIHAQQLVRMRNYRVSHVPLIKLNRRLEVLDAEADDMLACEC